MSTEIAVPFALAADHGIAVTKSTLTQTGQHVESLVATGPGERVVLAGYGVAARNAVFAPDDQVVAQVLQNDVARAMSTWEPDVTVLSVGSAAQVGTPSNSAAITVNWRPRIAQNPANPGVYTATILVGGDVV